MKQWLLTVTAAAAAAALARAMAPTGAGRTVVGMAAGMAVLLSVLSGVGGVELWGREWDGIFQTNTAAQAPPDGGEALKSLIAEKTGAYILDKGRLLGMECRVGVTVVTDASGWPVPWQVEVWGTWTQTQKEALSRAVEEELDIPAARQSFWEEGA